MSGLNMAGPGLHGLVSVIIPTYQRAYILGAAIESALSQTHTSVEVIVVDDGSSDNTREVTATFDNRVRYLHQPNRGVSAARNAGLRAAQGEFIAFLDSDDQWLPWKLEAQLAFLQKTPHAGMVWTDMMAVSETGVRMSDAYLRTFYSAYKLISTEQMFSEQGLIRDFWPAAPTHLSNRAWHAGDIFSPMLLGNLVHTSTVVMRREWLQVANGFDEALLSGEDYGFHVQTCSRGPVGYLDVSSIVYRIGADDQLTASDNKLHFALGNLNTIEYWMERQKHRVNLSRAHIRHRMAASLAWLGAEELKRGMCGSARKQLSASLRLNPWQSRTAALWLMCLFPRRCVSTTRQIWRQLKTCL